MKKRIFSVLVCLAVLVSTTMFQVGASYQPTDARQAEIDALIAKTDSHVLEAESINTSEVLPFIQASAVYEQDDGTQTPVDVDLQIQKLVHLLELPEVEHYMKSKPPLRKKRVPQVVAAKYRQQPPLLDR